MTPSSLPASETAPAPTIREGQLEGRLKALEHSQGEAHLTKQSGLVKNHTQEHRSGVRSGLGKAQTLKGSRDARFF